MKRLGPIPSNTGWNKVRRSVFGLKSREKFRQRCMEAFDFVFVDHEGKVLSNGEGYPDSFDAAILEISADKLVIRAMRFRGELTVEVASQLTNSYEWQDADRALALLDPRHGKPSWTTIEDMAGMIWKNWDALADLCAR